MYILHVHLLGIKMQTISYTSLRQSLSSIFNKIANNRETYHITRKGHESMVLIAESDFNAIQETLYLLSNPNNSKKLKESIQQAENEEFVDIDWDED